MSHQEINDFLIDSCKQHGIDPETVNLENAVQICRDIWLDAYTGTSYCGSFASAVLQNYLQLAWQRASEGNKRLLPVYAHYMSECIS